MSALLLTNLSVLALLLGGLVGFLVLLHLQERAASRLLSHHFGWRAVLVTGWLGVPVHELSHLLFACLFGHRIIAWKLLDPDPVSGTLGYVRHAYSQRRAGQLLGTFFIGIAPLLLGGVLLFFLLCWMIPRAAWWPLSEQLAAVARVEGVPHLVHAIRDLGQLLAVTIWQERSAWLPLQIYLGICIAGHISPSVPDLYGALPGALTLTLLLLGGTLLASHLGLPLVGALALLPPLVLLYLVVSAFQILTAAGVTLASRLARRPCPRTRPSPR